MNLRLTRYYFQLHGIPSTIAFVISKTQTSSSHNTIYPSPPIPNSTESINALLYTMPKSFKYPICVASDRMIASACPSHRTNEMDSFATGPKHYFKGSKNRSHKCHTCCVTQMDFPTRWKDGAKNGRKKALFLANEKETYIG